MSKEGSPEFRTLLLTSAWRPRTSVRRLTEQTPKTHPREIAADTSSKKSPLLTPLSMTPPFAEDTGDLGPPPRATYRRVPHLDDPSSYARNAPNIVRSGDTSGIFGSDGGGLCVSDYGSGAGLRENRPAPRSDPQRECTQNLLERGARVRACRLRRRAMCDQPSISCPGMRWTDAAGAIPIGPMLIQIRARTGQFDVSWSLPARSWTNLCAGTDRLPQSQRPALGGRESTIPRDGGFAARIIGFTSEHPRGHLHIEVVPNCLAGRGEESKATIALAWDAVFWSRCRREGKML